MNTIRKIKKNAKALSPVVASIILIAVTVAVSIAVAAWMGALVVGQMNTEAVKISNVQFADGVAMITARNTGSSAVTITEVYLGNTLVASPVMDPVTGVIQPNDILYVNITASFASGQAYQFKLVSSQGNPFVYTATAPT
jgi:flagellin-like protein